MHYQAKGRGVQRGWMEGDVERALCCGNGCHALVVRATSLALQPCYMSVLPHSPSLLVAPYFHPPLAGNLFLLVLHGFGCKKVFCKTCK